MKNSKKRLSKQKSKNKADRILRNALEKFTKDCESIMKKKKLIEDKKFLRQVANDILELDNDISSIENITKEISAQMLKELLEQPNDKFFTQTSLVDAALSFKYQNPLHSDLYHLMKEFSHYSTEFDDEYLTVFWSLLEKLKKED